MQNPHSGNANLWIVHSQQNPHLQLNETTHGSPPTRRSPEHGDQDIRRRGRRHGPLKTRETNMAYATDIRTGAARGTFSGILKSFSDARAQRKVYLTTLRELRALDTRDLADLGISASEIPFLAREAAYGK